jgi:Tol biopolymer transport system component
VALSGGVPQTICDTPGVYGAAWGPDDTIVFSPAETGGLYRVPATGGPPRVLTTPDGAKHEKSHRLPKFLPDGKRIVFTVIQNDIRSFDEARIAVLSLDTGQIRILLDGGTNPQFVSTGHLLYAQGSSLVAVPFDPRNAEITGRPVRVLDGVNVDGTFIDFAIAESGLVAYVRGGVRGSDRRVVLADRRGNTEPLLDARGAFTEAHFSPDGRLLAVGTMGPNDQIWLYDPARRTLSQMTFTSDNIGAYWTPDSKRMAFLSNRLGEFNFYWQTTDGSGAVERLTSSPRREGGGSWLPDGSAFAYVDTATTTGWDIWLLTMAPERRARPLIQTPANEWSARFSPDGRWLAYASDETGRPEVYVQSFPNLGAKRQISNDGGNIPFWDQHGRELYYRNGPDLMAVAIQTQPSFVAAPPERLFAGLPDLYGVAPDGRFVAIEPGPSQAPVTQINLIENWTEELKRLVATR